MRMYDLIEKKKRGHALDKAEICWMIQSYTAGQIPDYQMAAFLMAVCFQGMDLQETTEMTLAMAHSGQMADLSGIAGVKVDKHSTGGVGDKTTLIAAPMAAACGIPIAKMSGRGLGFTGGTVDKLESIPGYRTVLPREEFFEIVNEVGISLIGQSGEMAVADKKIYALRDVTATVDNMSLIASSIMSKKLAAGADAIVLDVKTGSGAFMKQEADAVSLAEEMTEIGNGAGRKTIAVITDMDQPLGYAVGNALEVIEAIQTLKGEGPADFTKLCLTLGSYMLVAGGIAETKEQAEEMLQQTITDGSALAKLAEFIKAQGGDPAYIYDPSLFQLAEIREEICAKESGFLQKIVCDEVGICSLLLGGGREKKEDTIDPAVGLVLHKKKGDKVQAGESLATIYANDPEKLLQAKERFLQAITIGEEKPAESMLIKQVIS